MSSHFLIKLAREAFFVSFVTFYFLATFYLILLHSSIQILTLKIHSFITVYYKLLRVYPSLRYTASILRVHPSLRYTTITMIDMKCENQINYGIFYFARPQIYARMDILSQKKGLHEYFKANKTHRARRI